MKANDLMIGNWAEFHCGYGKVTGITDAGVHFEDRFGPGIASGAEPVPITIDILERNGFEKKTFYGIYDDYFDFYIREYSDGLYIVTYHSCEFNIPDQIIHVSWVHELQNFMRHCGIKKEITI